MRRLVLLTLVAALGAALLTPSAATARKRCGTVATKAGTAKVVVYRGRVSCRGARKVARRNFFYAGRMVPGWFCYTAKGRGKLAGVCAPVREGDPDTARRVIRIYAR